MNWAEAFDYFVLCLSRIPWGGPFDFFVLCVSVVVLICVIRLDRRSTALDRYLDAQEEAFWEQRRQQAGEGELTDEPSSDAPPGAETRR